MELSTAILIAGMILSNSLLTVVTWFYILNKLQENIKQSLNQVKDIAQTVKQ